MSKPLPCLTCIYLVTEHPYEGEDPEQYCDYRYDMPIWVDELEWAAKQRYERPRFIEALRATHAWFCNCHSERQENEQR